MRRNKFFRSSISRTMCTSTTRPPNPFIGQEIFETDTGNTLFWFGTSPGWCPPWNVSWGRIALVALTADITIPAAQTDVAQLVFNAIKNRNYKYSLFLPKEVSPASASAISFQLTDGANATVNGYAGLTVSSNTLSYQYGPLTSMWEESYTGPNASLTRKARATSGSSAWTLGLTGAKGNFNVEDTGPNGAPG